MVGRLQLSAEDATSLQKGTEAIYMYCYSIHLALQTMWGRDNVGCGLVFSRAFRLVAFLYPLF